MRSALASALVCPRCGGHITNLACGKCGERYPVIDGTPALLTDMHAAPGRWPTRPRMLRRPQARVWSRRSVAAIDRALTEAGADDPDRLVVNIGAGIEKVWRRALDGRAGVARIGLPHAGRVDVYGDLLEFPLADATVDGLLSSSVLEHVTDPDRAVAEMARVIKPAGMVYAEIPFLRGYHMAPHDYQRYTPAGIERLFVRHGFETVEQGVCSGPFTALALWVQDTALGFAGHHSLRRVLAHLLLRVVHPVKYLDRLVEDRCGAEVTACNLFYLGRRVADAGAVGVSRTRLDGDVV